MQNVCDKHSSLLTTPFQPLIYFCPLKPGQCEAGKLLGVLLEGAPGDLDSEEPRHGKHPGARPCSHSHRHTTARGGTQLPHRARVDLKRQQRSLLTKETRTVTEKPSSGAGRRVAVLVRGPWHSLQVGRARNQLPSSHISSVSPLREGGAEGDKPYGCTKQALTLSLPELVKIPTHPL